MKNIDVLKNEKYQKWFVEFRMIWICHFAYNEELDNYYEYKNARYGVDRVCTVELKQFYDVIDLQAINRAEHKCYLGYFYDKNLSYFGKVQHLLDHHISKPNIETYINFGDMTIDEESEKITIILKEEGYCINEDLYMTW